MQWAPWTCSSECVATSSHTTLQTSSIFSKQRCVMKILYLFHIVYQQHKELKGLSLKNKWSNNKENLHPLLLHYTWHLTTDAARPWVKTWVDPNLKFQSLVVINRQVDAGELWWIIIRISRAITAHCFEQFIIFRGQWMGNQWTASHPLLISTQSMLNKKAKEEV